MLARKKRHMPRKIRPHNRNSIVQPRGTDQRGTFQPATDSSANSWNPNNSASTAQPDRKTTGCMKKGRVWSASDLVRPFGLIPNLAIHCRSMRRSIHLLNGEILRVQFISKDK